MSIEMAVKAAAEQPILLEQETSERRASVPSSELTIVIPAFNEEHAIGQVVEQIKRTCAHTDQEIIVVDDGSTDDTAITAEKAGARVFRHNTNMGYGAALKTAIRNARTAYILTMDSDGQHNAYDIWRLWAVVGDNDMVVGRRKQILHSLLWRMVWLLDLLLVLYMKLCFHLPLPLQKYMLDVLNKLPASKRRLVIYDQLNPAYAKYYTRFEAERLLIREGFTNVQSSNRHGYSWTIMGTKP